MKRLILLVLFLMAFALVYSQSCGGGSSLSTGSIGGGSVSSLSNQGPNMSILQGLGNDIMSRQYLSSTASYDEIEGSPYLTKGATKATLVMNDGLELNDIKIKYDLYAGEIIATNKDDEDIVLDTRYYKEIIIDKNGESLSFKKVNDKHPNRFYEVLYESGDVVFFKDQDARLRKGENLGITRTVSKFSQHKKYYVKGGDGALTKVNLKKRDVFDHFPELEAVAFREYIKSTKIKLSKEKDYKQLFAAMDDD